MKNNNKLAINAIRARKAQKKRANEQDKPKKGKRWYSRLFALIGCLLLVSALALPCFADFEQPTQKPIEELIVDVRYSDSDITTRVNLIGYYEIRINSFGAASPVSSREFLRSYGLLDIVLYRISTGEYYDVRKVEILPSGSSLDLYVSFFREPNFNGGVSTDLVLDPTLTDFVFYVRQFPDFAVNENLWSQFDYSVIRLVAPFEPDKVTSVWTDVMTWITNALASIQSVFYLNGSLTFLGTLAVIGVAFAIGWLIVGVVSRFLHLRG